MKAIDSIRLDAVKSISNLDLTKDYFSMYSYEYTEIELLRKAFNFSGRNDQGRSPARQFWYYLQRINEQRNKELKKLYEDNGLA